MNIQTLITGKLIKYSTTTLCINNLRASNGTEKHYLLKFLTHRDKIFNVENFVHEVPFTVFMHTDQYTN